jgi:hypothetical protein
MHWKCGFVAPLIVFGGADEKPNSNGIGGRPRTDHTCFTRLENCANASPPDEHTAGGQNVVAQEQHMNLFWEEQKISSNPLD